MHFLHARGRAAFVCVCLPELRPPLLSRRCGKNVGGLRGGRGRGLCLRGGHGDGLTEVFFLQALLERREEALVAHPRPFLYVKPGGSPGVLLVRCCTRYARQKG